MASVSFGSGQALSRQYTESSSPVVLGAGIRKSSMGGALPARTETATPSWQMEHVRSLSVDDQTGRPGPNPGGVFPDQYVRGVVDPKLPSAPVVGAAPLSVRDKYDVNVVTADPVPVAHLVPVKKPSIVQRIKSCFKSCCCCFC